MRILPAAGYRAMPWKNGGGVTREILALPTPGDWDIRLSMATVATDGPFSVFPGIDRTLTVLAGDPMELTVAGAPAVRLAPGQPFAFPGDAETGSRLTGGTVTDFNVMTRRGRIRHSVTARGPGEPLRHAGFAAALVLRPVEGTGGPGLFDLILPEAGETLTVPVPVLWVVCESVAAPSR
ncbi:HutD family protein [Sinirhodobacter populi]|nr:HutD family protein [Sinirhodobacter populi]